ncbi:MAG: tetratricopeptide repeat protein [Acidobacteria bacterium]|nr:tetratricopeptide repeat protein [Acidobacteriota bacterium]
MSKRAWLLAGIAILCLASGPMAAPWSQAAQEEPPTAETMVRHVRRALGRSNLERARAIATTVTAPADTKTVALALIEVFEGKDAGARTRLTPLVDAGDMGDALLELGLIDIRQGKRDEGRARLGKMLQQSYDMTPENSFRMARAAAATGDFRLANTIFQRIGQLPLQQADMEASWGDMFLEKHQNADALRSYRAALEADPGWIPAHLGLARTIPDLVDMDQAEVAASLETARKLAPAHPDVWLLTAEHELNEEDKSAAAAALDRVAAVRAGTAEESAYRAALAYAEGRTADVDAAIARAIAVNPLFGRGYRIMGEQAERLYRFDDAVVFARRATTVDPEDPEGFAKLGTYLMRAGDETAARQALETAFKMDPFNGATYNLLLSLDLVDGFESVPSGDFIFKFAKEEAGVLKTYALPLADLAYKTFATRYGFTPKEPILVEVFSKHDDFAVRTQGFGGITFALGACFGRVITMDSPKARPPGTFSWQATLWHEIAHVFSLQASNYRVPRWLTEGISVFEEHRYNKAWGREQTIDFARALAANRTFGVKGLPNAFQRLPDISLAYFEASLLTEHLVATHGDEGLRRLLAAYAGGAKDVEAFAKAFAQTVDEVDVSFKAFVEKEYGALARALAEPRPAAERGKPLTVEGQKALAAKVPGSYIAQWSLGQALLNEGDVAGATAALERAIVLAPMATEKDNPRELLAGVFEKQGDAARARQQWHELLTWDHDNLTAARKLAGMAREAGDTANEDFALRVVADVDPYDVEAHAQLGRRALAKKDYAGALAELQAVLALGPTNRAEAHADLAEAYLGLDRKAEAKAEALKALEQAPTFARAQDLLLAAIRK